MVQPFCLTFNHRVVRPLSYALPSSFATRDVVAALGNQTAKAREMLRKLLGSEIDLEPAGAGRERSYNFRGALRIDRLISGDTFGTHLTVVAPAGFEPVFE